MTKRILGILLIFFLTVVCIWIIVYIVKSKINKFEEEISILHKKVDNINNLDSVVWLLTDTFSNDNFYKLASLLKIEALDTVYLQHILESANFSSKVFKRNNNSGGYRTANGYLYFHHWSDCLLYTKRWQLRKYDKNKYKNYYDFLNDIGYAEDSTYLEVLDKIVRRNHYGTQNSSPVSCKRK